MIMSDDIGLKYGEGGKMTTRYDRAAFMNFIHIYICPRLNNNFGDFANKFELMNNTNHFTII